MAKLKHIRLDNMIYLTGFAPPVAAAYAKVLEGNIEGLMHRAEFADFRAWRRAATHEHLAFGRMNFSFHAIRLMGPNGPTTVIYSERTETDGRAGESRRGAYVYLWSQTSEEQQSIVSLPLVYLLREHGPIERKFTLYEHGAVDYSETVHDCFQTFVHKESERPFPKPKQAHGSNGMLYVGVTSRSWGDRFAEHIAEARAGSMRPFHRALREDFGRFNTRFHYVIAMLPDKASAFENEEHMVRARGCVYPAGLNAIPGGYEGLRYLAKMNALQMAGTTREVSRVHIPAEAREIEVEPGEAEQILDRHMRRRAAEIDAAITDGPEAKQGAALMALWKDPDFAERMVTSQKDRLSIEQIRLARYEHLLGRTATQIAESIGARSAAIVQRVLDGDTYRRVRGVAVDRAG